MIAKQCAVILIIYCSVAHCKDIEDPIKIILYTKTDATEFKLKDFQTISAHKDFNSSKSTVLYIHGYLESKRGYTPKAIVTAYLQRDDHNILFCDWGQYSRQFYFSVVLPELYDIGYKIASYLKEFFDSGVDVKKFHLVGHSLGAQLSGLIGRTLKKTNKYELERITGLDPALPGFYPPNLEKFDHISALDGKFVDIIHTDGGVYGVKERTGTADFYPNGGSKMPGCSVLNRFADPLSDACNHLRAVDYFTESVADLKSFKAVAAESYRDYQNGKVDGGHVEYMGLGCSKNATRKYFLQTNDHAPFSRGNDGIKFKKLKDERSFVDFVMSYVQSAKPLELKFHQADEQTELKDEESFDDESSERKKKKLKAKLRKRMKKRRFNAEALSDDFSLLNDADDDASGKYRKKLKSKRKINKRIYEERNDGVDTRGKGKLRSSKKNRRRSSEVSQSASKEKGIKIEMSGVQMRRNSEIE